MLKFIGFPDPVSVILERCALSEGKVLPTPMADPWTYREYLRNLSLKFTKVSITNHSELIVNGDFGCPIFYRRSVIAQVSFCVAFLAMLVHLGLVMFITKRIARLYGPFLIFSLFFSLLHSLLLAITLFADDFPEDVCRSSDILIHYLSLCMHFSVCLGLVDQYERMYSNLGWETQCWCLNSVGLNRIAGTCERIRNSVPRVASSRRRSIRSSRRKLCFDCHMIHMVYPMSSELRQRLIWLTALFLMPAVPVVAGVWISSVTKIDHDWNPVYGIISCGGVGGCIRAHQLLLYGPILVLMTIEFVFVLVISKHIIDTDDYNQQISTEYIKLTARFSMLLKITLSQFLVWITAFISNYICVLTTWQLYGLFSALHSLYILVGFMLTRPVLDIIFKRNDPLTRLKLEHLVINLPLGLNKPANRASTGLTMNHKI